jgi:uncharacterized protein (DUF58 family)
MAHVRTSPSGWSRSRSSWQAVTLRGRVVALVALAAALLGVVTGWREWLGVGAALGTLLVAAVLLALGRSRLAVELDLPASRVVVGEAASATLVLHNSAHRRTPPLRMELEVAGVVVMVPVPSLSSGAEHLLQIPLPTYRRDVVTLGPLRAVHGDPFGLVRRVAGWPVQREVFVHPRTVRPGSALPGVVRDLQGEESLVRTASDLAFHAVREYVPGDDRRFIHWKSSARSGTLQVREFRQTQRSTVALVVSAAPGDYHLAAAPTSHRADGSFPDDEFEVAVSAAASIAVELVRQRRDLVIDAAGMAIAGITAATVLDQFCAVDLAGDGPGDGDIAGAGGSGDKANNNSGGGGGGGADPYDLAFAVRQIGRAHPRLSLIVLVFGSAVSAARLRAAVRGSPPGAQVLAVRARAGWSPQPARVAGPPGCQVVSIADVDELPAALRAAMRATS